MFSRDDDVDDDDDDDTTRLPARPGDGEKACVLVPP